MANRISESEKLVMEVLWHKAPQSSLEITKQLTEQQWSEKTVRTFLGFLTNIFKGDIKELLATFVHSKQLSDDEVDYLKKLLKDERGSK